MSYQELIVFLPCHSLEDFPTYQQGTEADALLAACTALWHPTLLNAARKLPTWCRADVPPQELSGRLFVIPQGIDGWLDCDFFERAEADGATVVHGAQTRDEIVSAALAGLSNASSFAPKAVADFFALGFCRLQVELLTRLSRYTSTIDDIRLHAECLTALDALLAEDCATAEAALKRAFDQLCESRRYFFPTDPYLIDLTLVAESTLGESLRKELASPLAKNLLISARVLEQMAEGEPATLEALKPALQNETVSLVGGEYEESEFPLLPEETWREDLLRGISTYERLVGSRPIVYGRRRAGLSPLLPQLLCRTGFHAALHFTLDDGQFPSASESKVRWESPDGSVVEAIAQVPLDASKSEPFVELPRKLGEAMDRDQTATLVFAHWPGVSSIWFDDLRRVGMHSDALGKFTTLNAYFADSETTSDLANFEADEYRMPYLQQAVERGANPISRFSEAYDELNESNSQRTCSALKLIKQPILQAHPTLQEEVGIDRSVPLSIVALNYHSFPIRHEVDCIDLGGLPDAGSPIYAFDGQGDLADKAKAVVDIPGMGFAWIGAGTGSKRIQPPKEPILTDTTLRNEFCEVTVSPITGGIQSIDDLRTRRNRLSQQIALRISGQKAIGGNAWRDPDENAVYSVMVADSVEATANSAVYAGLLSRGRLVDTDGRQLARFEQTTALLRGSRVIRLGITLDIDEALAPAGWNNYYAVRFAFPDTELQWSRNIGLGSAATNAGRIEAPLFVEAASSRWRTSILCGGNPFHRRVLGRTLDTVIAVSGESNRYTSLGIGIDLPNTAAEALHMLTSAGLLFTEAVPMPAVRSGWLYRLSAQNVIATTWEPTDEGFRVRLRETKGASGEVSLQSWRPIRAARQTDFLGNTLCELSVEHDKIRMNVRPNEWIQVEASFA